MRYNMVLLHLNNTEKLESLEGSWLWMVVAEVHILVLVDKISLELQKRWAFCAQPI
ncbi:MAG: hypothetical protein NVS4B11_20870 [Ktedonobacteraceae bacterium]